MLTNSEIMRLAAAKLSEFAIDLKASTTANGVWPPGEEASRQEYDQLRRLAMDLRRIARERGS
jgi:hypothetical protein